MTQFVDDTKLFSIAFIFISSKADYEGLQKCPATKWLDGSMEYKSQHI